MFEFGTDRESNKRSHAEAPMPTRNKPTRGVALLMVISLLVLFVLLLVTFAAISGQYRRSSEQTARKAHHAVADAEEQLDSVLYQVLRDTKQRSSLHGHSLLRDLYGNDGIVGRVSSFANDVQPRGGNNLIEFTFSAAAIPLAEQPFGQTWIPRDDAYNGCVLTMLEGRAAGHSARVVDYFFNRGPDGMWGAVAGTDDNGPGIDDDHDGLIDEADEVDDLSDAGWNNGAFGGTDDLVRIWIRPMQRNLPANLVQGDFVGQRFMINGRPFNGTGFGFDNSFSARATADGAQVMNAKTYLPGVDAGWGVAGTDDDGINGIDDVGEAGWPSSDDAPLDVALLPHFAAYAAPNPTPRPVNEGGADESWDAVDFQNMFLAHVPAIAPGVIKTGSSYTVPGFPAPLSIPEAAMPDDIIPSFHRPALIRYWAAKSGGPFSASHRDYRYFRRLLTLRPMPWDHPNFTGSNVNLTPRNEDTDPELWEVGLDGAPGIAGVDDNGVNGIDDAGELGWQGSDDYLESDPVLVNAIADMTVGLDVDADLVPDADLNRDGVVDWDVDNDGNGTADSIWIDPGFPARTGPGGKLYKPLVAILIKDLDNRLNINTAGNRWQRQPEFMASVDSGTLEVVPLATNGHFAGALPTQYQDIPRGLGRGPAEIFVGHVMAGNTTIANQEYERLLFGRYGFDNTPSLLNRRPGMPGSDDLFSRVKTFGTPLDFRTAPFLYNSPPDSEGMGATLIDYYGQPISFYLGKLNDEIVDEHYEMDLSAKGHRGPQGTDAPYTLAELESLLRHYDGDAPELADRLKLTANFTFAGESDEARQAREIITTDSWHLPVPNVHIPQDMLDPNLYPSTDPAVAGSSLGGWRPGPDGRWGKAGVDDDLNSTIDDRSEAGARFSDDVMVPTMPLDLFAAKLKRAFPAGLNDVQKEMLLLAELRRMLPPEIAAGGLMNLNRVWGNGLDDNGNGTVDEPYEGDGIDNDGDGSIDELDEFQPNGADDDGDGSLDELDELTNGNVEQIRLAGSSGTVFDAVIHPTGNVPGASTAATPWQGRQLFARHLYCLMMFLKDGTNGGEIDFDGIPGNDPTGVETAQGLAQWAINMADFRDPDAIMTPFEYDNNPLDGWQVDGNIATSGEPQRGVVWGCERPELLLTETFAFHERRTEDLPTDDAGANDIANGDLNQDQRLRPKSGVFIELYNPWWSARSGSVWPPVELYSNPAAPALPAQGGVDLTKRIGPNGPALTGSPVWRMLINDDRGTPDQPRPAPTPKNNLRSVYFVDLVANPFSPGDDGFQYSTNLGSNFQPIHPGHYAVVGSSGRELDDDTDGNNELATTLGRRDFGAVPWPVIEATPANLFTDTRRFVFDFDQPHQFRVSSNQSDSLTTPTATSPTTMPNEPTDFVVPGDILPVSGFAINQPRSLSISEPTGGYPPVNGMGLPFDLTLAGGEGAYPIALNNPVDTDPALRQDGTTEQYRTVYLQRLANPLRPWEATTNPYMTLDIMSIDMLSFHGLEPTPPAGGATEYHSASHERGKQTSGGANPERNLWTHEPRHAPNSLPTGQREDPAVMFPHLFDFPLQQTFGYLNEVFHPYFTVATNSVGTTTYVPSEPTGSGLYIGAPDTINPLYDSNAVGNIVRPLKGAFPWLNWNNRPFVNARELLQVPISSPESLTYDFSTADPLKPTEENYNASGRNFGHLFDLFNQADAGTARAANGLVSRLFDFVHTPSPFVGSEDWFDPSKFAGGLNQGGDGNWGRSGVDDDLDGTTDNASEAGWPGSDDLWTGYAGGTELPTHILRPPFNSIPQFREPGRININTISNPLVWSGITNGFPNMQDEQTWRNLLESRRGSVGVPYPSFFSNPFRSETTAHLMPNLPPTPPGFPPIQQMRKGDLSGQTRTEYPLQATLMRGAGPMPATTPLFYTKPSGQQHDNTNRNSELRYKGLQRLENLVTTHSNVYAVWITLGYFEVEPSPWGVNPTHPDGYALGKEVGLDTGEVQRHRAFYVIDRSIPVAFEPGENHNVDRAIVLRRLIE